MAPIECITLFEIPDETSLNRVLEQYKIMIATATKNGKPYIMKAAVGASIPDPRNKGYNLSTKMTFASEEDLKYYENDCGAHEALKAVIIPVMKNIVSIRFENIL